MRFDDVRRALSVITGDQREALRRLVERPSLDIATLDASMPTLPADDPVRREPEGRNPWAGFVRDEIGRLIPKDREGHFDENNCWKNGPKRRSMKWII